MNAHKVFTDGSPTLWVNNHKSSICGPVEQVLVSSEQGLIPQLLKELHNRNIQSVMVEGGAETIKHFFASGLWDEALVLSASKELLNGIAAPRINAEPYLEKDLGTDILRGYKNRRA
jgi:diaminohydroxyphosphoribosylaminopyrimidine deaminase/5-amino-6-(5-phosphoribosylamino)uracil reductase